MNASHGSDPSVFARARFHIALGTLMSLAAFAAAQTAPPQSRAQYDRWIDAFRKPVLRDREAAGDGLVAAGPDAVPAVVGALADKRVGGAMVKVLGRMGPRAVPALIALLKDPSTRDYAGSALDTVIRPDSADQIPALLACLQDPAVKHYCGRALVRAAGPKAATHRPSLEKALQDPDADVRAYAASALAQLGAQAGTDVPALTASLTDPDATVRMSAAAALGRLGPKARRALEALKALKRDDPNLEVRTAAALAVKAIRRAR